MVAEDMVGGRDDLGDWVVSVVREVWMEMGCDKPIPEELTYRLVHQRMIENMERNSGKFLDRL